MVKDGWSIWCMLEQRSTGLIWMGLQDGKIIVYDPSDSSSKIFMPAIFEGRTIRQITEDKQGNVWFGSHGGHLVKWEATTADIDVQAGYHLFIKTGRIQKLLTDKNGFIWVATFGKGLYKIDPLSQQSTVFKKNGPPGRRLSEDAPNDILQYNDGILMITNGAVDVLNTRTNKITTISTQDGLPSNDVQCLQRDKNGNEWLGMISGLTRMSHEKKIFILYDRRDGIRYDIFNIAGAFTLPSHNLVFTTDHNFLVFDPEKMVQKDPPPDVKILDFKIANNSLLVDSLLKQNKINLEYNKNSISISFGTLSFLRNNKNYSITSLIKLMQTGHLQMTVTRRFTVTFHLAPILLK
ncbi:MAG: two-component regulator propeller domain-containing protein [Chitinophagaceae bacterium]